MYYLTPQFLLLPFLAALPSILASPAIIPRQSTCHVFGEVDSSSQAIDGSQNQIVILTLTSANGATLPNTVQEHTYSDGSGNVGVYTLINQAMPYQMTAEFNLNPNDVSVGNVTFTYASWGPATLPLLMKGSPPSENVWTDAIPFPC